MILPVIYINKKLYILYKTGTHGGKTWVSAIDNNIWEPGVYGWEETV